MKAWLAACSRVGPARWLLRQRSVLVLFGPMSMATPVLHNLPLLNLMSPLLLMPVPAEHSMWAATQSARNQPSPRHFMAPSFAPLCTLSCVLDFVPCTCWHHTAAVNLECWPSRWEDSGSLVTSTHRERSRTDIQIKCKPPSTTPPKCALNAVALLQAAQQQVWQVGCVAHRVQRLQFRLQAARVR